ncbi:ATP-binding protein [Comamonas sp. HJ-2]
MAKKSFDLNIEKILENWEVRHGIREVIANALDEQILTGTAPVVIEKRDGTWIIRDEGRGIRYTHLTQNENQEKLDSPLVIGRFGIGLKDALATFERHGVKAQIKSKFGTISTHKSAKHGFGDILTLHAIIEDPLDPTYVGTEFQLEGVEDKEMEAAKALFLKFSDEELLATTRFGQIISRKSGPGAIYINGVKVAEEANFLFSYNITQLSAAIKKAINRERSHVGRTAYSDSVKKILLASTNGDVARTLAEDISRFQLGEMHDELAWIDVQEHAVRILNAQEKVVMVTAYEAMRFPDLIDQARQSGNTILTIPENLRAKIADSVDIEGNRMVDITQFTETYNDSFNFDFVDAEALSSQERKILDTTTFVIEAFGGRPAKVAAIKISNTMRPDLMNSSQTLGCWDPSTSSIVIWRPQLNSFEEFSGVLIHELVHAKTGYSDVTRDFESALTTTIGDLCLGWWNAVGKSGTIPKSVDARVPLTDSAKQTNAISEPISYKELTTKFELQQVELSTAYKTIAQLRADAEAKEAKARTTVLAEVNAATATEFRPSIPSPSVQDIKASQTYGELLTTKEAQAIQLDKALQTIVRLREDVDIERKKTTQALNERHSIQTDLNKFQAMQREVSAERSPPRSAAKPWYKFW